MANTLGCGFLEKVYANALAHELRKVRRVAARNRVTDDDIIAGEYFVDLLVDDATLIDLKTAAGSITEPNT